MEKYEERIERAKEKLKNADFVLLGIGSGFSTAAGLEYMGDSFQENYSEYIQKYHFSDLYTASFYPFSTQEEKWAFWAKLIKQNRFNEKPLFLYQQLYELVKEKKHFVLTTNVDGQFEKAGFSKENVFYIQGDYALLQCEEPCHNKTYFNKEKVEEWIASTKDCKIPTNLIPKCPICERNMEMNLRKDANFVQDAHWYQQAEKYEQCVQEMENKNVILLEIGVGFNTPGIIRFPFEQFTYELPNATLIRINQDYPFVGEDIQNKAISFSEEIADIFQKII